MTVGKLIAVTQPEIPIMDHRPATESLIRRTIRKTRIQKIITIIIATIITAIITVRLIHSLSPVTIRQRIIL